MAKRARDTRWLEQRRLGWYCVKSVPVALQAKVGRKKLIATLNTRDLTEAVRRRRDVLLRFDAQIAAAREGTDVRAMIKNALSFRDTLRRIEAGLPTPEFSHGLRPGDTGDQDLPITETQQDVDRFVHGWIVDDAIEDIEARHGEAMAAQFAKIARGLATPIGPLVEPWITGEDIAERSRNVHRQRLGELLEWIRRQRLEESIEQFAGPIGRQEAGKYYDYLRVRGLKRTTLKGHEWSLSSFWKWLIARGHATGNPWEGHGIGRHGRSERQQTRERAFTVDELRTLLDGPAKPALRDLMALGLYTGARIEELCLLRVGDVDKGHHVLKIRGGKTAAATRDIPIHSAIAEIVERRTKDQVPGQFLFPEFGPEPKDHQRRSDGPSVDFMRYRRKLGVDEVRAGNRRAAVNFHSFRRSFITLAERGGQQESVIRFVVGHSRPGETFGTYSAGPSLDQRRACVEAVRLPPSPSA